MSFIIKTISLVIIFLTVYILWIFLFPDFTDDIAKKAWILKFNTTIRNFKSGADDVSERVIQLQDAKDNIDYAKDTINKVNETINKTSETIEQKIDQTQKVIESWEKVINSTKELKENIDNLTTVSWSSN